MSGAPLFDRYGVARVSNCLKDGKPAFSYVKNCGRCGGAGGADKWKPTGWTCFECGGSGKGGHAVAKLYTAEQLAKLNVRRDALRAKIAAKRQAAAEARAADAMAKRDEFAAAFPDVVAYLAPHLDAGVDGFVPEMARALNRFGCLSEAQVEAVRKFIAREKAEEERKAAAGYVGDVGDRVALDVSVIWSETYPGKFGSYAVVIMRTANGSTVKSMGSFYKPKGWAGAIVATVKAQEFSRGEPVTQLKRVKSSREEKANAAT